MSGHALLSPSQGGNFANGRPPASPSPSVRVVQYPANALISPLSTVASRRPATPEEKRAAQESAQRMHENRRDLLRGLRAVNVNEKNAIAVRMLEAQNRQKQLEIDEKKAETDKKKVETDKAESEGREKTRTLMVDQYNRATQQEMEFRSIWDLDQGDAPPVISANMSQAEVEQILGGSSKDLPTCLQKQAPGGGGGKDGGNNCANNDGGNSGNGSTGGDNSGGANNSEVVIDWDDL